MSDEELLKTVSEFRRGILGRRHSEGMCWCVCAPLQVMLQMMGTPNDLIEGTVGGNHHFYLMLHDGRVIDPTGDQFKALKLPKVFIGRPGRLYRRQRNWTQPRRDAMGVLDKVIRQAAGNEKATK